MDIAIETKDLGMVFRTDWGAKKRALEQLNLEVPVNQIFGFLGHNGAGKTTTIKILVGLCSPTEGSAKILGQDITQTKARKNLGFLPENPYFYEYLTAKESLKFYGGLCGLRGKQLAKKAEETLSEVGLSHVINQQVRGFSKGMKQRLGLAQAMIHDPDIYILDEPLSGLDPVGRREIREKIQALKEQKKTIFFSSHVLADVEMLCDNVALLSKGKLSATGKLENLLQQKIISIEIVGSGFSEAGLEEIKPFATHIVQEQTLTTVKVKTEADAHKVKEILERDGGILKAFIPHKESLEDYYLKQTTNGDQ